MLVFQLPLLPNARILRESVGRRTMSPPVPPLVQKAATAAIVAPRFRIRPPVGRESDQAHVRLHYYPGWSSSHHNPVCLRLIRSSAVFSCSIINQRAETKRKKERKGQRACTRNKRRIYIYVCVIVMNKIINHIYQHQNIIYLSSRE